MPPPSNEGEAWFAEREPVGVEQRTQVRQVLYEGRSAYQNIRVLDTVPFGRALVLDTALQTTETDEFIYHGYTELYLAGKWVKATPAFNLALCEKFGVKALEFDGREDSIFHPFDVAGNKHMEYLRDHGQFADFSLEKMVRAFKEGYPHLFGEDGPGWPIKGDFEREAVTDSYQ